MGTIPSTLLMNYDDLAAQGVVGPGSYTPDIGPGTFDPSELPQQGAVQSTLSDFAGQPSAEADLGSNLVFKGQSLPMQDQVGDAQAAALPTSPTSANESDFGPLEHDRYPKASTPKQIKDQSKALDDSVGFWPTFLSVAAALNGNFGPALALQEQKRKTQLAKYMEPHLRQINTHISTGELKEAGELADQLMASVGSRSPEIGAYMKEVRADIRHKQGNINAYKNYITHMENITPEDSPNQAVLTSMKKIMNTGGASADHLLPEFVKQLTPHIQIHNGQILQTNVATGATTQTRLNVPFSPDMLKGRPGDMITAETGWTHDQISDILNNKPIEGSNGQVIPPDPTLRTAIRDRLAELARTEGDTKLAANIPMSPEQAMQGQRQGLTPTQLATRTVSPEAAQGIMQGTLEQQTRLAEVPELVKIRLDPTYASRTGLDLLNVAPGANFLETVPATTLDAVEKSGGNIIAIPKEKAARAQELGRAVNKLGEVEEMFKLYGIESDSSPLERIVTAVNRKFSSFTGITFRPEDTAGKAAEVIANRAIEELANDKNIPDARVRELKSMVTGIATNKDGAMAAVRQILEKAQYELGQSIGKQHVDAQKQVGQYAKEDWLPVAQRYGVPPQLVDAILRNEGSKDNQASFKGAMGRFQVMPETAAPYLRQLGATQEQLGNREVNNHVGIMHIADLWNKYKDMPNPYQSVLGAYHGGPKAVLPSGQIDSSVKEPDRPGKPGTHTVDYARKGLEHIYKAAGVSKPKVSFTPTGGR
jgi:hypothetical protein